MPKPLAYDVGANVGANLPYYLAKGFRVIAVDADPSLTEVIRTRHAAAIAAGDLEVLNVGVGPEPGDLPFYLHEHTEHNSFAPPEPGEAYRTLSIEVRTLSQIIAEYGEPAFLKLDVEGLDAAVLRELIASRITPPLLQVEVHTVDVAATLVAMGYPSFQLVSGRMVGHRGMRSVTAGGQRIEFPPGAAGPMGDDLRGPWVGPKTALQQWLARSYLYGWGWFDLHARLEPPHATLRGFASQWRNSVNLRR
jgi:FkbM family methyltransferase